MNNSSDTAPQKSFISLSAFSLKIIAIVGMSLNHAGYLFFNYLPIEILCLFIGAGGLTFPIMAFLLVEGYRHTSNMRNYAIRLLLFAIVSQVPYFLFLAHNLNIFFTLLLGLALLYLHDTLKSRTAFWVVSLCLIAASALSDWGIIGPIMVLVLYLVPHKRQSILTASLLSVLGLGIPALSETITTSNIAMLPFVFYPIAGCSTTIPLLLAYSGQRGKSLKWFFYAYYPLHIITLGLLKGVLLNDWSIPNIAL